MMKARCNDSRPCFGKERGARVYMCNVLKEAAAPYKDGECPFCKPQAEYTNGRYYPIDKFYGQGDRK